MLYFRPRGRFVEVEVYQIGEFQLNCGRFELLRNGHSVRLERKPLELLILLVRSRRPPGSAGAAVAV